MADVEGPENKHNAGQWKKGQSGNPGGRPRDLESVRQLARKYSRLAVMTLVRLAKSADKDSVRAAAAVALLDRGYGKPTQPVSGEDGKAIEFVIRDLAKEGR